MYCFTASGTFSFEQKDVLTWESTEIVFQCNFISFVILCILLYALKSTVPKESPQALHVVFMVLKRLRILDRRIPILVECDKAMIEW